MDYKKKYVEALKRAKKELDVCGSQDCDSVRQIFRLFPELKGSEDERIKKDLIDLIYKVYANTNYLTCAELEGIRAWLERQGEHKTTDKVKPNFNVDDWITFNGGIPFKILKIEEELSGILDYLLIRQDGHKSYFNKKYVDENARLWTIQDATDGDVLTVDGRPFIYCCNGGYQGNVTPATKEQRDLLFVKMKEAGYEWDNKKKEPKKIETKGGEE